MKKQIPLIFLLLSTSAIADSYICVSKTVAQIQYKYDSENKVEIEGSYAGDDETIFVVSDQGLRFFDQERVRLPTCISDEISLRCYNPEGMLNGVFGGGFDLELESGFFTLDLIIANVGTETKVAPTLYAGLCSKI